MQVDMIIVDCIDNFTKHIQGEWKIQTVDRPGAQMPDEYLTCGPFKNTPIKEDSAIGKEMVAIYAKHLDGYGQIRRWNYRTKEEWKYELQAQG